MQQQLFECFKNGDGQKKHIDTYFLVFLGSLAVILVILSLGITFVTQQLQEIVVYQNPFPYFRATPYPVMQTTVSPTISAEAAIVMDASSHGIFYQKNAEFRFSPASTTKIMTALVSLEYFHPTDVLTIKNMIDSEGSGLDFFLGEQITFENVLQAALIYSANDAAVAIAENYPGGATAFVAAMNAKAQSLHLWNTHFGDPDGLDDTQDYTTATDLASLSAIAMQQPLFQKIVKTKATMFTSIDGKNRYRIKNRNILLGRDGITGIKTGYTDEAGEVLATSIMKNGHTFYIVVMHSQDRFADTLTLVSLLDQVAFVSMYP